MICELCGDRETLDPTHICGICTSRLVRESNEALHSRTAVVAAPNNVPLSEFRGGDSAHLSGRLAVVTGGNRGIGRAIGERLLDCGADLHVVDINESNAAEIKAHAAQRGRTFAFTHTDVTDDASVRKFAEQLRRAGRPIHILVNNAGVFHAAAVSTHSRADWDHQFAVNVTAAFVVTQALLPLMPKHAGACIVNLASVAGLTAKPFAAGYIASKHAMVGWTRALALELASDGITVNAIAPGFVDTDMMRQITEELAQIAGHNDPNRSLQELIDAIPQKRLLQPQEIADVAAFLASSRAGGMTGEIVNFSGGWLLS